MRGCMRYEARGRRSRGQRWLQLLSLALPPLSFSFLPSLVSQHSVVRGPWLGWYMTRQQEPGRFLWGWLLIGLSVNGCASVPSGTSKKEPRQKPYGNGPLSPVSA